MLTSRQRQLNRDRVGPAPALRRAADDLADISVSLRADAENSLVWVGRLPELEAGERIKAAAVRNDARDFGKRFWIAVKRGLQRPCKLQSREIELPGISGEEREALDECALEGRLRPETWIGHGYRHADISTPTATSPARNDAVRESGGSDHSQEIKIDVREKLWERALDTVVIEPDVPIESAVMSCPPLSVARAQHLKVRLWSVRHGAVLVDRGAGCHQY